MEKKKKLTTKKVPLPLVKEPEIKKHEIFDLNLTKFELLHLRDVMSVLLSPEIAQTLSQALALTEDRATIESMLWNKVSRLCKLAKLPMEAEAPDYIIAPISPPSMGVFQVNQDLQDSKKQNPSGFLPEDEDEQDISGKERVG